VGRERLLGRAQGQPPTAVLGDGLVRVSRALVRRGVTAVGDATPRSGRAWRPLREQMATGRFLPRVSGMRPVGGRPWAAGDRLWPGPVKILVEEEGTTLRPRPSTLARVVARAAAEGDRVAVHCVGAATLVATLAAFEGLPRRLRPRWRHRLEHVAECPPPLVQRVAALGLVVVTNPVFVAERGDVYRRETDAEAQAWLYRAGSFTRAGVRVAAASDAPVATCDPWAGLAAARTRRTRAGVRLGWQERVGARAALDFVTTNAALAMGAPMLGRLRVGGPADLLVVDRDPLTTRATEVGATEVLLTMVAGEVAWRV
jgi:predicted amidohydrolase YtcJ